MFEWKPLEPKALPDRASRTAEERKWNHFRFPTLVKESGAATHLDFHPLHPHDVAVCCGPRIRVFDGYTAHSDAMRTFSKFHGPAYGVKYRADGRLVVCGGEEGRVRVFDDSTRSMLKQFKGHTGAVRATLFAPNKTTVMSGGDDGSLRGWDIGTGTQLFSSTIHDAQIRSGAIGLAAPDVWMTGGYDKRVTAFDTRSNSIAYRLALDDPVEAIIFVDDSGLFAAAAGPAVALYDIRNTASQLVSLANHAKTVTCLDTSEKGSKLLTGSADQTVKLWNLADSSFQCVLTRRFAQPVLSMGISPDEEAFFVVGMADGTISMELRPPHKTEAEEEDAEKRRAKKKKFVSTKDPRHFYRGADSLPGPDDVRVASVYTRTKKSELDNLVRKYMYKEAIDHAVNSGEPSTAVALFSDFVDRNCLDAALAGRTDESVGAILQFISDYITVPHFDAALCDVFNRVLKLYSASMPQSEALMTLAGKIKSRLDRQVELQMQYVKLQAAVESVQMGMK